MGLLDEAIRDHLELKRRRGADPSEIARAEHDALEPVFRPDDDATRHPDGAIDAPLEEAIPVSPEVEQVAWTPDADADDDGGSLLAGEPGTLSQDTVEIDMQAVLQEDACAAAPGQVEEDELLEWEAPVRASLHEPVEEVLLAGEHGEAAGADVQIPGQERISFE